MSEGELAQQGWVSFEYPRHGWVHKPWYTSWPPPAHLAVTRVVHPVRGVTYGVVDALAWITDAAFFAHADVVTIYDQTSVSAEGAPVSGWTPPEQNPLLPAAVYTRRPGAIHTSLEEETDGA